MDRSLLSAPEKFSIIENVDETLFFFQELKRKAYLEHKVYIDLKNINKITPDSILYLLSLLSQIKKNKAINITGNAPKNISCRKIFLNSGFYDYVNSNYTTNMDEKFLTVKSENIVDGSIASNVISFACRHLNLKRGKITKAFYTTILECMGNTREHAYESKVAKYAKWWLTALYNEDKSIIRFAILDNGKGIPNTVKRKFIEKTIGVPDSTLLKSVMNGDFRTSTELKYRGKGLPKIKSFKSEKLIQDLVLVSNKGYYYIGIDRQHW